jgi:excinuclease ABC subunit C
MNKTKLAKLLKRLPRSPGVYLMKDAKGQIIYVGKAVSLRDRVRQYFTPGSSDTRLQIDSLRRRIADVDMVPTASEKEALLLEYNLIQRHTPPFNIRLRDDKNFLSLKLDPGHEWPKLELVRRPAKDGAYYFGPYHSASAARETLRLVNRHFKLRSCSNRSFARRQRPCLQHQIHRCMAPCVLDVDREEYAHQVRFVRLFLEGRRNDLVTVLERQMKRAAGTMAYERAALLRDQIRAVEKTLAPQRITSFRRVDQDVVGLHRDGDRVQIAVLLVRSGRMTGQLDFGFSRQAFPDEELLSSFLVQRYAEGAEIPHEVVVSRPLPDAGVLAELLTEERGRKVRVIFPRRGPRVAQVRMADTNARQIFESRSSEQRALEDQLSAVQRRLRLPGPPHRIECVDISHLGGTNAVGAIGAVTDGQVDRSRGRTYKLRAAGDGDDYAAIEELLGRRFRRAAAGETGWEAPDLLVVDGGRGQLARALAVLGELGIDDQPVVALAKQRQGSATATSDRLFLPGRANPIALRAGTSPLRILALARDEAHRRANRFQSRTRRRIAKTSELDRIPGVGPKIRAALLTRIGSLKQIRQASLEDLAAAPGVGPKLAARIKEQLG